MKWIDELTAISNSEARAAIVALLFGDDPRPRHQSEIAKETGLSLRPVQRELERLVAAGLVARGKASGMTLRRTERVDAYMRPYWADPSCPIYPELRAISAKIRGSAGAIRAALPEHARLAWITGAYALSRAGADAPIDVVVVGHPKQLIVRTLERLGATTLHRPLKTIVMYQDEWVARLDKRELTVRRLRAGPKLWLRGDGFALRDMERGQRETKDLLKQVIATGEDLTDEWDDDWDPDRPTLRALSG